MTNDANDPSVVLFFIDGLGIGTRGPHNPLDKLEDAAPLAVFQNEEPESFYEGVVVPTDPCLGVPGRPQSASGQTTILTGVNAPAQIGYHKQGFPNQALRMVIRQPLQLTETTAKFDILVNVAGGGPAGQAGAIRHGITRALMVFNSDLRPSLKSAGLVTRDPRIKERKKYGQKGARKRFQFSKR